MIKNKSRFWKTRIQVSRDILKTVVLKFDYILFEMFLIEVLFIKYFFRNITIPFEFCQMIKKISKIFF